MIRDSFLFRLIFIGLILMATSLFTTHAAADYPEKPIRIVVPYPPGGSTDSLTRLLGLKLQERLGQAVVVENRAGASGMIGAESVARSAPDGYTLLMTGSGPHTINVSLYKDMRYHPEKDFTPIALTSVLPLLMVTPKDQEGDLTDFISWAKENPDKGNYCSVGPASPSHLAAELFKSMASVELLHIPYKGSGPAIIDTIAGTCNVLFDSALSSGPHVRQGSLKALGVASTERLNSWPDLATLHESGLPGYEAYSWTALVAPAGTPKHIIETLEREMAVVLALPDVQQAIESQGAIPGSGSAADMAAFTASEIAKWAKVIKDSDIQLSQ